MNAKPTPYFSLARAEWVPRVITWDLETGFVEQVDGPKGFTEYRTALEGRRFLTCRERRQGEEGDR